MADHVEKSCPFCNPAIDQAAWLETVACRVIYNIAPIVPGHSLVIPKRHVSSLMDLTEAEVAELFLTARRAVQVLLKVYQAEGFDLSLQDGEAAGQTVSHLHVHTLPRKPGDLPQDRDWYEEVLDSAARPRLSSEALQQAIQRLRQAVLSSPDFR